MAMLQNVVPLNLQQVGLHSLSQIKFPTTKGEMTSKSTNQKNWNRFLLK